MTFKTHRILLTGAAGGLGQALRPRLAGNCSVLRLSDIAPAPSPLAHNEEWHAVDLSDKTAVLAMAADVDAIVHLGGVSTERPFEEILPANIVGVYNLYEAARKQGVKRVVFASSNHVTGYYKQSETIDAAAPPRPDGWYGISKAYGEDVSRFYFDRYGIETACIRIGSSFPEPKDRRMLASWMSYDDLHRLVVACLSTPALGHSIVFGMSNNAVTWWDNRLAKHVGFVPQDSSDVFRDAVYARTTAPDVTDPAVIYQGGGFLNMGSFADLGIAGVCNQYWTVSSIGVKVVFANAIQLISDRPEPFVKLRRPLSKDKSLSHIITHHENDPRHPRQLSRQRTGCAAAGAAR